MKQKGSDSESVSNSCGIEGHVTLPGGALLCESMQCAPAHNRAPNGHRYVPSLALSLSRSRSPLGNAASIRFECIRARQMHIGVLLFYCFPPSLLRQSSHGVALLGELQLAAEEQPAERQSVYDNFMEIVYGDMYSLAGK